MLAQSDWLQNLLSISIALKSQNRTNTYYQHYNHLSYCRPALIAKFSTIYSLLHAPPSYSERQSINSNDHFLLFSLILNHHPYPPLRLGPRRHLACTYRIDLYPHLRPRPLPLAALG